MIEESPANFAQRGIRLNKASEQLPHKHNMWRFKARQARFVAILGSKRLIVNLVASGSLSQ